MSTSNIKVRDAEAYSIGFNKGHQAAEHNRKLTSITASIFKSVFYREYHDSFYQGVADGWQHSFDQKKRLLKQQAVEKTAEKEGLSERSKQHNAKVQQERELSPQEKAARLAQRQAQMQQNQQQQSQQKDHNEPEIER